MVNLIVMDRRGSEHPVEAQPGLTLMEPIRDAGFDELMALCGGCCSCAMCHVHIDDGLALGLSRMGDVENDLLDSSDHRNTQSRLACQIRLTEAHSGLGVATLPRIE